MQVYTHTDSKFQVLKIWKCQALVRKINIFFNDYGKSNCTLQNNLVLFNLISVIHTQEMIKRQLLSVDNATFI